MWMSRAQERGLGWLGRLGSIAMDIAGSHGGLCVHLPLWKVDEGQNIKDFIIKWCQKRIQEEIVEDVGGESGRSLE